MVGELEMCEVVDAGKARAQMLSGGWYQWQQCVGLCELPVVKH
jgi:hypothetical protein